MAQHPFLENLLNGQAVEWKPLGEVFDTITDFTAAGSFASNAKNVQYLQNTGFAQLIRTTDLKSKFSNNSNFIYTDKQGFDYLWRVNLNQESIILPNVGNCGEVYYINPNDLPHDNNVLAPNALLLRATGQNNCFFFHLFQCNEFQQNLYKITSNTGQTKFNKTNLKKIKIPIPPLSVQTKIVQILDVFTAIIAELTTELNMRNRQYQYYRDKLLTHDLEAVQSLATASDSRTVVWKTLGDVFDIFAGGDVPKEALSETRTDEFNIPILSNGIGAKSIYGWTNQAKIHKPSLTISARGTIGWTSIQNKPFFPIVRLLVLTPKIDVNLKYLYYYMKNIENHYKVNESGIPQLTKPMIKDISIPIPSLSEQARIVAILDKFDTLTQSITEGLPREIELRQKQYEYYREALLSF